MAAETPVAAGRHRLGFRFEREEGGGGPAVAHRRRGGGGRGAIPTFTVAAFSATGAGLTCGYELGPAVGTGYVAPFPCTADHPHGHGHPQRAGPGQPDGGIRADHVRAVGAPRRAPLPWPDWATRGHGQPACLGNSYPSFTVALGDEVSNGQVRISRELRGTGKQKVDGHERDLAPFEPARRKRTSRPARLPPTPRAAGRRAPSRSDAARAPTTGASTRMRRAPTEASPPSGRVVPAAGPVAAGQLRRSRTPRWAPDRPPRRRAPGRHRPRAGGGRRRPRRGARWWMERRTGRTDPAVRRMAAAPGLRPPAAAHSRPEEAGRGGAPMAAILAVVAVLAGAGTRPLRLARRPPPRRPPGRMSSTGGSGSSGSGTRRAARASVRVRLFGRRDSPFGGSGSTGSGGSSTGAGAPSDISAIAAKVDPELVDINTNLSYEDEQAAGTGMVLTSSVRSSPTTTSSTAPPASA